MSSKDEFFLFLSPEVERLLASNDIEVGEFVRKANLPVDVRLGKNPASDTTGKKETATILLATAAVIAALTPLLKEALRNLSGRLAVVRERRLLPVEDSNGKVVLDASGQPLLHWVHTVKDLPPTATPDQTIKIKGFGIEISFGDQ